MSAAMKPLRGSTTNSELDSGCELEFGADDAGARLGDDSAASTAFGSVVSAATAEAGAAGGVIAGWVSATGMVCGWLTVGRPPRT